jgi:hypothetical protein
MQLRTASSFVLIPHKDTTEGTVQLERNLDTQHESLAVGTSGWRVQDFAPRATDSDHGIPDYQV